MVQANISLESILDLLKPLSTNNKKWLADRLYEEIAEERSNDAEHIDKVSRISRLRGIGKGITARQIAEDDKLAYILSK